MSHNIRVNSTDNAFSAADHETILEAALRQGVALPYGCRDGACGACKAKITSGDITYQTDDLPGISETEQQQGFGLMCQAIACSDVTLDVRLADTPDDIKIRKLPARVIAVDKLNHDVMRIRLKLPKTERLAFLAGQYIDILMADGKKRSFSLANAPHNDEYLELHIRYYAGGLFSEYAFNELNEKALMRIEGPMGSFYFREDSERPVIMVAGGTGFAPIKSIIEHSLALGSERPIQLYWGARSRNDLYLHELAQSWANDYQHIEYIPVLSEPKTDDNWDGREGFVHHAVLEDYPEFNNEEVYTCGPPPMTKAVCESFVEHGLGQEYIFSDSFEFAPRS